MSIEQACANCEFHFSGKYCSNCGQKADVPRFTFAHIFEEVFHAFTHADKSFLTFVKKLFLNPGKVAYEYIIERKRKQYFNPFTFFLLIVAVNAFVEGFDLTLKDKLFHYNNEYGHYFNVYSKVLSFAVIPVLAFTIWLIHLKKERLRYSEYTVFAMILLSLFSMIGTIVHSIDYLFTLLLHKDVSIENNIVYLVILVVYLAYADHEFHRKTQDASWIKGILTGICFFLINLALQAFIVWGLRGFHGIGNFDFF